LDVVLKGNHKGYGNPYTGMDRPLGYQDVEAPTFEDNWHMNVVRLSALHTVRLNPKDISWY